MMRKKKSVKQSSYVKQNILKWIPGLKGAGFFLLFMVSVGTSFFIWNSWPTLEHRIVMALDNQGVRLQKLTIEGRHYTHEDDLAQGISLKVGDPLLLKDPKEIQARLIALPWIKAATVRRQMPSTLNVRLIEQYPIAVWQRKESLSLIDDEGHVIDEVPQEDVLDDLLVVTGEEAPLATPMLLDALRAYPHVKQRVTGALFIGKRRWDVLIDNKIRVKLPEMHLEEGLAFFEKLESRYPVDSKEILFVDVRNPKKAYVRYRSAPVLPSKAKKNSKQA